MDEETIIEKIKEDDLPWAFEILFELINSKDSIHTDLVISHASFKRINKAYNLGLIDFDKMYQKKNFLLKSILDLLKEIDSLGNAGRVSHFNGDKHVVSGLLGNMEKKLSLQKALFV